MNAHQRPHDAPRLAIVVKGYPRLSETFIAQEMLGLEQRGLDFDIWSLRHPTDGAVHMLHQQIKAKPFYLPEYLWHGPLRVLKGFVHALTNPHFGKTLRAFWADLKRDPTPNRMRRIGQAFVLAREMDPRIGHIHVHYLHTPCSVVRYAAQLRGIGFSFSAHAKDIWTTPDWERREKIDDASWGVTCTRDGLAELRRLLLPSAQERVELVYHGLDLRRFPAPPTRNPRDGARAGDPVRFVSVGRAVKKKGYDDLLQALATLPPDLHWRFVHIGSGELKEALKAQAAALGIADKIEWRGALPQDKVIATLRDADIFVLPCKEGPKGDRDGLPNVILEAATQALPILSTNFAGVPEFVIAEETGLLVAPGDSAALARDLNALARDPALRARLGQAAHKRITTAFSFDAGVDDLAAKLMANLMRTAVA
jgi:glycosyltransferase involved in cell wall biosynthesis